MSGRMQDHTLVYTIVVASFLAVYFDLSRITSLGTFFYLVMDILIRGKLATAIILDLGVFVAFGAIKLQSDPLIVIVAAVAILAAIGFQRIYLGLWTEIHGNGHAMHKVGAS